MLCYLTALNIIFTTTELWQIQDRGQNTLIYTVGFVQVHVHSCFLFLNSEGICRVRGRRRGQCDCRLRCCMKVKKKEVWSKRWRTHTHTKDEVRVVDTGHAWVQASSAIISASLYADLWPHFNSNGTLLASSLTAALSLSVFISSFLSSCKLPVLHSWVHHTLYCIRVWL